jgi:hypothetical protein
LSARADVITSVRKRAAPAFTDKIPALPAELRTFIAGIIPSAFSIIVFAETSA